MTLLNKIYNPIIRASPWKFLSHSPRLQYVTLYHAGSHAPPQSRMHGEIFSLLKSDHKLVALYRTSAYSHQSVPDNKTGIRPKKPPLRSGRSKLQSIVELMRLNKPTGTILAFTPSLWAMHMALPVSQMFVDTNLIFIFLSGAIVARAMGCTLNDILDRDYDRQVERTMMRPIACGDISTKEALLYLSLQSIAGLGILCLNNLTVIKLGLFSGLMISTYPLFKRFTYWPQVMLGLTINWGVLMGYAAVNGSMSLSDLAIVLPVYLGANFWTLFYDTIYAHQDRRDDLFVGVKSSAIKLGKSTKKFLYLMSAAMHTSLATAGVMSGQQESYYLALAFAGLFHYNQVRNLNINNPSNCWAAFNDQKHIAVMIIFGLVLSSYLKHIRYGLSEEEKNASTKKITDKLNKRTESTRFW